MKFKNSLIATSVLAAAATASAKTTMNASGEAFYQTKTFEKDMRPDFDDDQKTASGVAVSGVYVGFDTQWDGFSTTTEFFAAKDEGMRVPLVGVEKLSATTSYMGGALGLTIGLQEDMTGGLVDYSELDNNGLRSSNVRQERFVTEGFRLDYNYNKNKVSLFVGSTPDELYYAKFGEVTEDDSTSKFLGGTPYMGFGYHGQFSGLEVLATYHMRSTGDYTVAGADLIEDASQSIMTLGLGYEMGMTSVGFDYSSRVDGKTTEAGEDNTTTSMQLKASHTVGAWVPTLSYMTSTVKSGDAEATSTGMNLDVAYTAGKGHELFFAYDSMDPNTDVDEDAATTMYLGVRFDGSMGL